MEPNKLKNKFIQVVQAGILDIREAERTTAELLVALVDGWLPGVSFFSMDNATRCRAGYLIALAAQWSKDPQKQKLSAITEKLRAKVSKNVKPVFFYPGEPSTGVNDDLTLEWDLQCGCVPANIRQHIKKLMKIDTIIEDAVASSLIEGYITSKREKEQLREWYIKGLSADEVVTEIKKDMGLDN